MQPNETVFIPLNEAAALLGKTDKQMREHAKAGDFGATKKGNAWVFDRDRIGLLCVEDVAKLLRVNIQTVRRWGRQKVYPATKIGRRYYFTLDALKTMQAH